MLDFLTALLFEDLLWLLMAEGVALAVVVAIHRRRATAKSRRAVWITLGVCILLVIMQYGVVTQRELIQQLVKDLATAVDDGDIPAIADRLDGSFQYGRWNKDAFVSQVRDRLQRWQIDRASAAHFDIKIDGDEATVSCRGTCNWRSGDQVETGVVSFWILHCVRHPDGWKLQRIVSAKVGFGGMIDLLNAWNY